MSRRRYSIISVVVLFVVALLSNPIAAQPKRAPYGPVVKAYLTGLDEELNELEFQLRHREIRRADYLLARQRLAILRRAVERHAAERREDIVPEYQVLAEGELGTLGLSKQYKVEELVDGTELEGQWKIVEVQFGGERQLTRFFVLERLQRGETTVGGSVVRESKLGNSVDPRDVVETIVVRERAEPVATPQAPASSNNQATTDRSALIETKTEMDEAVTQKPRLQSPRILHIYLPEYTGKAREKKVEGEVVVRALFQRNGKIKNAKVEKGLGFGLDDRAVEAVKRIGFFPAQLDGKEVDAQARIVFNFKLEKVSVYVGAAELSPLAKENGNGERN
ncbi:MAG: energy transducer TonB [Blastocatellia bacterium]